MGLRRFFILLVLVPLFTEGQTVKVTKENTTIEGETTTGYQFAVVAPESDVKTSVNKYLKAMGRTKSSGDYVTVAEPVLGARRYSETLYATTRQVGNTTAAWFGMFPSVGESAGADKELEKVAYDFGVYFHREKIQQQIDESTRAQQTVEKQQNRLVNQHKDLTNKIEGNKREKIQLEKSLVDNKVELEELSKNLESNVKAQDSLFTALEQIRKVVEMHKERQKNVN